MSRVIVEAPTTLPVAFRTGEIAIETAMRAPSLRTRSVSNRSTRSPRASVDSASWSSWRRSSGTTSRMFRPTTSSAR
jgi:hypothetical protein